MSSSSQTPADTCLCWINQCCNPPVSFWYLLSLSSVCQDSNCKTRTNLHEPHFYVFEGLTLHVQAEMCSACSVGFFFLKARTFLSCFLLWYADGCFWHLIKRCLSAQIKLQVQCFEVKVWEPPAWKRFQLRFLRIRRSEWLATPNKEIVVNVPTIYLLSCQKNKRRNLWRSRLLSVLVHTGRHVWSLWSPPTLLLPSVHYFCSPRNCNVCCS